jgi:hypothetical protein
MGITHVNDTRCSRVQASLHQLVVLVEVIGVKIAAQVIINQVLPSHRQTEDVHLVILCEVIHLANTTIFKLAHATSTTLGRS